MIGVAMSSTDQALLLRSTANSIRRALPNPPVYESLGWADLPVMMQQIDHPSFSYKSEKTSPRRASYHRQQPAPPRTSYPFVLDVNHARQSSAAECHKENALKLSWAIPQAFTTFGWSDFPIYSEGTINSTKKSVKYHSTTKKQHDRDKHGGSSIEWNSPEHQVSTPSTESTKLVKPSRHIQFSQVHVREHSVRLGDHPLCFSYPMSLDWSHGNDKTLSIDEYEAQRRPSASAGSINKMDVLERRLMLAESMGVTLGQMDTLEQERKQRRTSVDQHRTELSLVDCNDQSDVENFLEMSMHIGNAHHPGLESQLLAR